MKQVVRVLKSPKQLEEALKHIAELMDQELKPGSKEEAVFELLQLVISDYESKSVASPVVTPLQAIRFRMEQQRLTPKDLEPYIGSRGRVAEVLNRARPLTLAMIRRLSEGLKLPADVLIADYKLRHAA